MSDLVWSSSGGDRRKRRDEPPKLASTGGRVKVKREVAGRRGKPVTSVSNVPVDDAGLRELAGRLKKRCGVGGTAKDGVIDLQGDHRTAVVELLRAEGYDVVLAAADRALDATLLGYTRLGYALRPHGPLPRMDGKVVLVTGASSGLGRAAAGGFEALGASVVDVVRDPSRARPGADVHECDVSSLADVKRFAASFRYVDVLVHNAGALPGERRETAEGNEVAFATNVLGPFELTKLIAPRRVITVTSGGMLTARLDAYDLQTVSRPYRGARVYAQTKRAEMILTAMWAERGIDAHAMHPGWADTPGLAASLPGFHRALKPLLRTPRQGADTILWLGTADVAPGRLWHDRAERDPYRLERTRETAADRARLWAALEDAVA